VNELERLNEAADSPFSGKLDTSRMALMGHSFGGEATILGVQKDRRFRAGVILDGVLNDAAARGTDKPILILAAGREQWDANECKLWNALSGPRLAVNFRGAEHLTPSDAVWLAKGAIKAGNMGPNRAIAAIRDFVVAFLDADLLGKPPDRLLTGPSPDYPDAVVTTGKESLCSGGAGR
jgi:dienelactone hydrolase